MQWLIIGLIVSVMALLLAVAGVARHIRRHRKEGRGAELLEAVEEHDQES